ncbi:MAG TPA: phosphotransferase [Rhizomicrobium sp.]
MSERLESARAFLAEAGWKDARLSPLPSDASTRHYTRVASNGRVAMLMDQPQSREAPPCPSHATADERRALGYNATARLAGADCGRFIATARFLRRRGIGAPDIYAGDTAQGFVLLEDFGDELYSDVLENGGAGDDLYAAAIDAIAQLHAEPAPHQLAPGTSLHAFDQVACLAETDLMTEWFMPLALGRRARDDEVDEHRALWREALQSVRAQAPVFVHRDYHAQNLFWLPARTGVARVGMIDFQDAVAGNRSYDLISLLEDARRDVAPGLACAMKQRYANAMKARGQEPDADAWSAEIAVTAAQRNTKIAGIFARLASRDGKPRYLSHLPRVWGYLEHDLEHPALAKLRAWYDRTIPKESRRVTKSDGAAT